jgi:hypothetical protein
MYHCAYAECEGSEMMPYQCDRCERTFCPDHRHPEDHGCIISPADKRIDEDRAVSLDSLPTIETNNTKPASGEPLTWLAYLTVIGIGLFGIAVVALTVGWV